MKSLLFVPIGAAVVLTPFTLVLAQQSVHRPSAASTRTKPVLTYEQAHAAAEAAVQHAREAGAGGAVAVVDDGGYLICLHRIDGTFPAASAVATDKTRTTAVFHKATKDVENAIRAGCTSHTAMPKVLPLEGGVPIAIDSIKLDWKGNVYVCGPGGLCIASPSGERLGLLKLPEAPHNIAFGGIDGRTLFMCCEWGLYRIQLLTQGVLP